MKKILGIIVLGLLLSGNAYAGQKIIYLGGSSWKLDDGKDKDFTFSEGGSCEYSYINLWRSTYKDCQWLQEGPKVKIIINKGHYIIDGYISGQNFKGRTISKSHGTGTIRGYVTYHEKVYKNWISQEEKLRIAVSKRKGLAAADTNAPYYRALNTKTKDNLPTLYTAGNNDTNTLVDNANTGGLVTGRPWT